MLEDILIPISFFAMSFGIVYLIVTSRHRQRMALIEKGMDPNLIKSNFWVLAGFIAIGTGIGLMFGYLLDQIWYAHAPEGDNDHPLPYFIMVLLCGGLALVAHHFIVRRKQQG
ncbi:MAG TPA: DUF6249 domain-containing protein [Flavobacteriales bacterium]|nr:DUF6249 domain-containing protein [Flavobacteriales bacterium]